MYLSVTIVFGISILCSGQVQGLMSFFSWILSNENYILMKLESLGFAEDYIPVYLKASWLENTTNFKHDIWQYAPTSVDVTLNRTGTGNLAIVLVYVDNYLITGTSDFFNNTMPSTSFADFEPYLISGVLSVSIYDGNETIKDAQVEYTLPLIELNESFVEENVVVCGFYDEESRYWSDVGCNVLNITKMSARCYCSHLTSFSVLVQISDDKVTDIKTADKISSSLTNVGVVLSIIFLIITLIIICGIKELRESERYLILRHLVIALLCVHIFFAFLDVDLKHLPVLCGVHAGCLHYSLLAAFSWMLIMSTDLYMKIRRPFMNHEKRFRYSRFAAWICPVIVVGLTAALTRKDYASDNKCWLDYHSGAIWAFIVPVCITLSIVPVQLVFIGYVAFKKSKAPNLTENELQALKRMRNTLFRVLLLTPAVGVMWIFGIIIVFNDSNTMEYIFIVLNSSQGFFVWLSQCVFSQEVRTALKKTFGAVIKPDNTSSVLPGTIN